MREAIGGGKAIIPSNVKVASAGTAIDMPLGDRDDVWLFDNIDTMTVWVPDAPRPAEIVVIVALSDGGRHGHASTDGARRKDRADYCGIAAIRSISMRLSFINRPVCAIVVRGGRPGKTPARPPRSREIGDIGQEDLGLDYGSNEVPAALNVSQGCRGYSAFPFLSRSRNTETPELCGASGATPVLKSVASAPAANTRF